MHISIKVILHGFLKMYICFISEVIPQWVLEPNNPTEAVEGENITLRWDYSQIGDTVDLIQWLDMKNTEAIGKLTSNGPVVYPHYTTRFKIDANEKCW